MKFHVNLSYVEFNKRLLTIENMSVSSHFCYSKSKKVIRDAKNPAESKLAGTKTISNHEKPVIGPSLPPQPPKLENNEANHVETEISKEPTEQTEAALESQFPSNLESSYKQKKDESEGEIDDDEIYKKLEEPVSSQYEIQNIIKKNKLDVAPPPPPEPELDELDADLDEDIDKQLDLALEKKEVSLDLHVVIVAAKNYLYFSQARNHLNESSVYSYFTQKTVQVSLIDIGLKFKKNMSQK